MRKILFQERIASCLCGFTLLLLLFPAMTLSATPSQERCISGVVTSSATGKALSEVRVWAKGTHRSTITCPDGTYSLSVQEGETLEFSFVAYLNQEIRVQNQTVINVVLEEDRNAAFEIFILGYPFPSKNNIQEILRSEVWVEQPPTHEKETNKRLLLFTKDSVMYRSVGDNPGHSVFPYYLSDEATNLFDFDKVGKHEFGEFIVVHSDGENASSYKMKDMNENKLVIEINENKEPHTRTYNSVYGQYLSPDTIYFIATTIPDDYGEAGEEGILRANSPECQGDPLYKYPPIHIELSSRTKGIYVSFGHYNYNPTELAKTRPVEPVDEMVIWIKPIDFLQTIRPIDLDVIYPSMSKYSAESFGLSTRRKVIFFIDRNEITPTTVKLIQVDNDTPDSY